MSNPTNLHLAIAHKILQYINGAPGQGVLLPSSNDLQLKAHCDLDWGSCPDTIKSVIVYCVFLGDSLISWKSKKQSIVSRSSAEAEYRAMATTSSELTWLCYVLDAFQVSHSQAAILHCDNMATLHIASNPVFHERTKHIELNCHLIRDKIQEGSICTSHVSMKAQVVDVFTKALPAYLLHCHLCKMGIVNYYSPSYGEY